MADQVTFTSFTMTREAVCEPLGEVDEELLEKVNALLDQIVKKRIDVLDAAFMTSMPAPAAVMFEWDTKGDFRARLIPPADFYKIPIA